MTTKKLENYMNDPDIINEPMPLREVHAIRLMIQDEIKDMSPKERKRYYRKGLEDAEKRCGFKFTVVSSAKE